MAIKIGDRVKVVGADADIWACGEMPGTVRAYKPEACEGFHYEVEFDAPASQGLVPFREDELEVLP